MRLLLTGASGFVGTHLRQILADRLPEATVLGLGAFEDGPEGLPSLDLRDSPGVEAALCDARPDVVVHLAAQASVARGSKDFEATWSVNLAGSLSLALAIAQHAPEAIVLVASTAEVYGASFLDGPASETTPMVPLNTYAKSKALAERLFCEVLPPTARLIIARPSNHTGPGQSEAFVLPSFAGQIARIEAGLHEPRIDVGNLDVMRDFLDVRDVAEAYCGLLKVAPSLPTRFVVNIASGRAWPIRDLLDILLGLAKLPIEVGIDSTRVRQAEVPCAAAEPQLLEAVTGWRPRRDIHETLQDLLTHARERLRAP